jgi:dUTP pyrophosphatase
MKFDLDLMKTRVLEIADPSNPYTQEDFNKEFNTLTFGQTVKDYRFPVKLVNKSTNENPEYTTNGASGFDFRANLPEGDIVLKVGKIQLIPTGLFFELAENFEIQVRPRSGLAAKHGITVLNSPGTIDADYRGETKIILINLGEEDFPIKHGDRIAQGVVASVTAKNSIKFEIVDSIADDTERGSKGFGSTGVK